MAIRLSRRPLGAAERPGEADVAPQAQARQGAGADGFVIQLATASSWAVSASVSSGMSSRRTWLSVGWVIGVLGWFLRAMRGAPSPGLVTAA